MQSALHLFPFLLVFHSFSSPTLRLVYFATVPKEHFFLGSFEAFGGLSDSEGEN
jgi:hypothetical protein